ncbi:MAG: cell division protein FtsX [Hyphomicrobiaceae bacterium]
MSASFDRGGRGLPPPNRQLREFADPQFPAAPGASERPVTQRADRILAMEDRTGPPRTREPADRSGSGDDGRGDPGFDDPDSSPTSTLRAEGMGGDDEPRHGSTSIVPTASVTSGSLTLVVVIMCFFACLTAGAVYLINQSANAWQRDIASEVTVQVEPRAGVDMPARVADIVTFLNAQQGLVRATEIDIATTRELLEPWLGSSSVLESLPLPRLIAVVVDRSAPADLETLRARLTERFPGAALDDHRQWQRQIQLATRSVALGGITILLLVALATVAIIVSATRSAMAANREIVEVLHLVGADDRFIAKEFERHFLGLGIKSGLIGAGLAAFVFLAMPTVMDLLGGTGIALTEMRRMVGSGGLDMVGFAMLMLVVFICAALCMMTSRYLVYRILNARD